MNTRLDIYNALVDRHIELIENVVPELKKGNENLFYYEKGFKEAVDLVYKMIMDEGSGADDASDNL